VEDERALWAKPPHFLIQAAQRVLDRLSRFPVKILHGNWSQNYDQTCNFSYVLAGVISARDLLALKTQLCEPFQGSPTDLVPACGWSWAQLQNVPTVNKEGNVWTPEDLYNTFIANPCFKDALICAPPHWQGNPITLGKDASTVFIAYINNSNIITQQATNDGVYMFGAQVAFIHCGDSPTLIQCSRCHMLRHYATSERCKAPKNLIKCYRCGAAHDGRKHDYKCLKKHAVPGKCDCRLKCLLCGDMSHHCRSLKCLKRGPGPSGISKLPEPARTDESKGNAPWQTAPTRQKQMGNTKPKVQRIPYTNHAATMTVPAGACANDPEKSNILCECCPLPSLAKFIT
jgi:hypothetical protein